MSETTPAAAPDIDAIKRDLEAYHRTVSQAHARRFVDGLPVDTAIKVIENLIGHCRFLIECDEAAKHDIARHVEIASQECERAEKAEAEIVILRQRGDLGQKEALQFHREMEDAERQRDAALVHIKTLETVVGDAVTLVTLISAVIVSPMALAETSKFIDGAKALLGAAALSTTDAQPQADQVAHADQQISSGISRIFVNVDTGELEERRQTGPHDEQIKELEILREYAAAKDAEPSDGVEDDVWDAWVWRWTAARTAYRQMISAALGKGGES